MYLLSGLVIGLTLALLCAGGYVMLLRADVRSWDAIASAALAAIERDRDERYQLTVAARSERESLVNDALHERQDLYRRLQAPETGAYVMGRAGETPDDKRALHRTEDDEIREAQRRAIEMIDDVAGPYDPVQGSVPAPLP